MNFQKIQTYEDALAVLGRSDELPLPFKNDKDRNKGGLLNKEFVN